jgi:hypothetical protein
MIVAVMLDAADMTPRQMLINPEENVLKIEY